MKTCEHIIGVLHDYEDTKTTTYEKLVKTVNCANDTKRRSTALERFKYCPVCGARLDWVAIKNNAERYFEEAEK